MLKWLAIQSDEREREQKRVWEREALEDAQSVVDQSY